MRNLFEVNRDIWAVGLLGLVFLSLSLPYLELPGTHAEEAFLVEGVARWLRGEPYGHESLSLAGLKIPLMVVDHAGSLSSFLYLPGLYFLGSTVYAMRLTRVLVGLSVLVLLYLFALRIFDRRSALFSGLLLATLAFQVFMFRQGFLDDGLLPVLLLGALLCFLRFQKTLRPRWLSLGFFVLGLGLWNKLNFLWALVSLGVLLFLYRPLTVRQTAWASLFLLLGASPFLVYNLHPQFYTYNTVLRIYDNILEPRYSGNNLEIKENLETRASQVKNLLDNDFNSTGRRTQPFLFVAFLVALHVSAYHAWRGKRRGSRSQGALLLGLAIVFLLSIFTITTLRHEHFTLIVPFLVLLVGKALSDLAGKTRFLAYGLLALLLAFNVLTLWSTYAVLVEKGVVDRHFIGWEFTSPSIDEMSDYLRQQNIRTPITIGSGIASNVEFLTQGAVRPVMCEDKAQFEACLQISTQEHYLIKSKEVSLKWWRLFSEILVREGKTATVERVFSTRDGEPELLVLKVIDGSGESEAAQHFRRLNR